MTDVCALNILQPAAVEHGAAASHASILNKGICGSKTSLVHCRTMQMVTHTHRLAGSDKNETLTLVVNERQ